MDNDRVLIDRSKLEEIEILADAAKQNFPYLECEFSQYSMFKYWVPKKGVAESEVIDGLRSHIKELESEISVERIKRFNNHDLAFELSAIKSKWWYKLFS